MSGQRLPGGVVHKLPVDLRKGLISSAKALDAWKDITPLARNEFICWVEDAKQAKTRERRIRRTCEELEEGRRRPCCWPGCKHRERKVFRALKVKAARTGKRDSQVIEEALRRDLGLEAMEDI